MRRAQQRARVDSTRTCGFGIKIAAVHAIADADGPLTQLSQWAAVERVTPIPDLPQPMKPCLAANV